MMNHYSGGSGIFVSLLNRLQLPFESQRHLHMTFFIPLALLQRQESVKRISKASSTMQPSMLITTPAFLMRWEANEKGNAQIHNFDIALCVNTSTKPLQPTHRHKYAKYQMPKKKKVSFSTKLLFVLKKYRLLSIHWSLHSLDPRGLTWNMHSDSVSWPLTQAVSLACCSSQACFTQPQGFPLHQRAGFQFQQFNIMERTVKS